MLLTKAFVRRWIIQILHSPRGEVKVSKQHGQEQPWGWKSIGVWNLSRCKWEIGVILTTGERSKGRGNKLQESQCRLFFPPRGMFSSSHLIPIAFLGLPCIHLYLWKGNVNFLLCIYFPYKLMFFIWILLMYWALQFLPVGADLRYVEYVVTFQHQQLHTPSYIYIKMTTNIGNIHFLGMRDQHCPWLRYMATDCSNLSIKHTFLLGSACSIGLKTLFSIIIRLLLHQALKIQNLRVT